MKKTLLTFIIGLVALVFFESFDLKILAKQQDGSNPGFTGSPGDSLRNCTACHGGTAITQANWIKSSIPEEGFEPGVKYTIRAVNKSAGHTRFGFSISPQAIDGKLLGTLVLTDSLRTQLNGNGKYITYKTQGVFGVDSAVWLFDWIAPTDVNEVVFYGAFNSNHEGHKGSDLTTLSTLKVFKKGFTAIKENTFGSSLHIFPNPAQQTLHVSFNTAQSEQSVIKLYNLQGECVWFGSNHFADQFTETIDVSGMAKGIYLLHIQHGATLSVEKVLLTN